MPRVPPLSLPAAMEQRPTVLLVDDEESVQKLLTYPLEREGYRVVLVLMLPRLVGLAV